MIGFERTGWQLIIMVKEKAIKNILIKLFLGFIIYFAIINILIFNQFGTLFTPREWLLNPLFNLFIQPNPIAWIVLLMSELVGWFFFETRQ